MSTPDTKVLYMIAILNETYIEELGLDYMRKPIVYLSAYSLTAGSRHTEFEEKKVFILLPSHPHNRAVSPCLSGGSVVRVRVRV